MFIERGTFTDSGGAVLSERGKLDGEIGDTGLLYQSITFIKFQNVGLLNYIAYLKRVLIN
jgi:hypothetical protein